MMTKQQEDLFISRLIKSNDSKLWDEFYIQYDKVIFMVIHSFKIHKDEISDIAQEVRLQVWKKLHLYKPKYSKFTTWLSRVAKNRVIDYLRSKYSYQERTLEVGQTIKILTQDSTSEIDKNAKLEWKKHLFSLAKDKIRHEFSPQVYSVFSEINEGSNTNEIAEKLKIPSNTVHVYKRRVENALQKEINRLKLETT